MLSESNMHEFKLLFKMIWLVKKKNSVKKGNIQKRYKSCKIVLRAKHI